MPQLDMPLKELKNYLGCTPIPADFDQYWNDTLLEFKDFIPSYTISTAQIKLPNAIAQEVYFTAKDGSKIYVKILRPDSDGKKPVMLNFHGYGCSCMEWTDKLSFVHAGFAVISMDVRGQGGKSSDNSFREGTNFHGHIVRGVGDKDPKNMMYRSIFTDIVSFVSLVKTFSFVDSTKMITNGSSQGGALSLVCASLCCEDVIGCIAQMPFLSDYKRIYEMDLMKDAYYELFHYIKWFLPEDGDREEFWTRLGYIDIKNLVKRIKAEVLFSTGLADNVCPPSSQFATFNAITAKKTHKIYSNFGHEWLPGFGDESFVFACKKVGIM